MSIQLPSSFGWIPDLVLMSPYLVTFVAVTIYTVRAWRKRNVGASTKTSDSAGPEPDQLAATQGATT